MTEDSSFSPVDAYLDFGSEFDSIPKRKLAINAAISCFEFQGRFDRWRQFE